MAKIRFALPGGQTAEGEEISIDESNEKWSELKMADGTVIRIKAVVSSVLRLDGQYDATGQPLYIVKSTTAVSVVSVPDELRRKPGQ